jgi:hypothetical protein
MTPTWLTVVAWAYLSICFCCATVVAYDIAVNRRRQHMGIMNFVYPITALYFGPLAIAFYWRWARAAGPSAMAARPAAMASAQLAATPGAGDVLVGETPAEGDDEPGRLAARRRPQWVTMAIEVSHCGSGCALGDVISEFAIFWLALTIAGTTLLAEYTGDYVLALAFGILFQYFAIADGVRDWPVRLDGDHDVRLVPRAASPGDHLRRLLVSHASRHDDRIRHVLARERVAGQAGHQGSHVSEPSWRSSRRLCY